MRRCLRFALAMLPVLVSIGCRPATPPAFSPDGKILAFAKKDELSLRTGAAERKIAGDASGPLAWSGDGRLLAFASRQGTTLYNMVSGGRQVVPQVGGPYFWHGDLCVGFRWDAQTRRQLAVTMDARSGTAILSTDIPFEPTGGVALPGGELLLWQGTRAYRFDGLGAERLPALDGASAIGRSGAVLLLANIRAPKGGFRHRLELRSWSGAPRGAPVAIRTLDLDRYIGSGVSLLMIGEVRGDASGRKLALLALAIRPSRDADRLLMTRLIRKYDLLNASDASRRGMSKAESDALDAAVERGTVHLICLAGDFTRPLTEVARYRSQRGVLDLPDLQVAVSPGGDHLALVTSKRATVVKMP